MHDDVNVENIISIMFTFFFPFFKFLNLNNHVSNASYVSGLTVYW